MEREKTPVNLESGGEVIPVPRGRRSTVKGSARFALEQVLNKYMAQHPGQPVVLMRVAKEIGVSRQRLSQLYPQIAAEREVPPLKSRDIKGNKEEFDQLVKELLSEGLALSEVAQKLCVTRKLAPLAKSRIYKKNQEERSSKIKRLKEQGLTIKGISEITGLSRGAVDHTLRRLYRREEAQKPRKKYKTREESKQFKECVTLLRLDPRNLTNAQIAEITGESVIIITNYTTKLIGEGRIPKR